MFMNEYVAVDIVKAMIPRHDGQEAEALQTLLHAYERQKEELDKAV